MWIRCIRQIFALIFAVLPLCTSAQCDTICLNRDTTITSCNLILFDSGGESGNYSNNENYTITICPENPTSSVVVEILSINTEIVYYDYLKIYDGSSITGGALLATIGGTTVPDMSYMSTPGNSITIFWYSDGDGNRAGFVIRIHCVDIDCHNYSQSFLYDEIYDGDMPVYVICNSSSIVAKLLLDDNEEMDEQAVENTFFRWSVINWNRIISGMGLNVLENLHEGLYTIKLSTVDANNCGVFSDTIMFMIMDGSGISLSGVPEESVSLYDTLVISCGYTTSPMYGCIEDVTNSVQNYIDVAHGFPEDAVLEDVADIESICMEIEHSYLGDLEVWITCPSGNRLDLFNGYENSNCSWEFLGEPIDVRNNPCEPGVPYHYCWTHDASQTIEQIAENPPIYTYTDALGNTYSDHQYIPAGDYTPIGDWSSLLGCPLNGEWKLHFRDHMGISDGYLFSFSFNFNYEGYHSMGPYLNEEYFVWTGHGIISGPNGSSTIVVNAQEPGLHTYTVSATSNYGCSYDTTFSINFCEPNLVETYIADCDSSQYRGVVYYESGDYLVSAVCGDEEMLHLTISHPVDTAVYVNNIGDYVWNDETFVESGTYTIVLQSNEGCDSVVTLHLTITDIAEFESEKILLYPNPADDIINIVSEVQILSVDIVSPIGQVVYSKVVNAEDAYLDIKNLSSGAYYVRVWFENDKLPAVMKFVKQEP